MFRLDLWEPYGLLLVSLWLRWMAFLSILGDVLFSTSVTSFFINLFLQTSILLLSISAASSETLISFWVGSYCSRSNKCLHGTRDGIRILTWLYSISWVNTWTEVWDLPPWRLAPLPESRAYGSYFSSPINEPCSLQCGDSGVRGQKKTTGRREGHSQHSSVCLTQQGGLQLYFKGDDCRGKGMETLGLEGVGGMISTDGKSGGKMR